MPVAGVLLRRVGGHLLSTSGELRGDAALAFGDPGLARLQPRRLGLLIRLRPKRKLVVDAIDGVPSQILPLHDEDGLGQLVQRPAGGPHLVRDLNVFWVLEDLHPALRNGGEAVGHAREVRALLLRALKLPQGRRHQAVLVDPRLRFLRVHLGRHLPPLLRVVLCNVRHHARVQRLHRQLRLRLQVEFCARIVVQHQVRVHRS
mmetsp:Transcript_28289/g.71780  ORF Transcript_28289/g.71780 Transcript_28289/m.71780 type:complete len:203 (+) Transcript_28289:1744-2352(+)